MRSADDWKNVFCLEGLWETNLKLNSSVESVLRLLNTQYPKMKYIHGDCATVTEFKFYLNKWMQSRYNDYPVLYLAFHGEEGCILLSDGKIKISEISNILKNKCKNRIVIFASCSTLNIDKRIINTFIKEVNCLAVCGYRNDVDWVKSTAFELLLLEGMQDYEFSGRGIGAIHNNLTKLGKSFPELEFRMVVKKA